MGTMHLDFECKGAYVELLILQFNKDDMTIHMIKHVLGHRFDHIWPQISDKFQQKDGKYWNERLRTEKEKRVKYSESRKKNRNSKKDMLNHMSGHMENEDVNENNIKLSKNGKGQVFSGNYKAQGEELFAARFARHEGDKGDRS